ncbi:stage III sporulation protein AA [Clostridiisalibacter paucivorans]|uniref:stage III sporulation protein AA n=1 Tax=Clostridiisalibacter paucivorans TaxID=408753 RepID=UPI000688BF5F|nr:stage III sporulation protein AA [Clostridiisalibacter paucivorans]
MDYGRNVDRLRKTSVFGQNAFDYVIGFIDPDLFGYLNDIPREIKKNVEEIRLRINRPLLLNVGKREMFIDIYGNISSEPYKSIIINKKNIEKTFQIASNYSVYAVEDDIKKGFITIKGGHRIGLTGKAVYNSNDIETIKDISSLNMRIAKEKTGVSNKIMPYIIHGETVYHTLIVSPPQCGKTTLLRDIIRNISNGIKKINFRGIKVGIVDERSEIAGVFNGAPQMDIGLRTDVLDACKKYDGIISLIRSMAPMVIATDELGEKRDAEALKEALRAGVKVIATVHGEGIEDIKNKPHVKEIMERNLFERIILLDNSKGVGTIRDILDGSKFKSVIHGEI